jgi:hypothetical protein
MGYRRAKAQMRRELDEMTQRLDAELCRIDGEQRAAREQVARSIDNELEEVRTEMQAAREEFNRYRAIEHAIDTERDPNALLN